MEIVNNINWIDVLVVIILVRGGYIGAKNGLTAELFNFIGITLGLVVAVHWYSQVADIFIMNFNTAAWLPHFLCFVIIAQLIRVIFKYGVALLLKILNIQFVPQLERIGGGILGSARGVLVAAILFLAFGFLPFSYIQESIYKKSFSGLFLIRVAERTYSSLTFWIPPKDTSRDIFNIPAIETKR